MPTEQSKRSLERRLGLKGATSRHLYGLALDPIFRYCGNGAPDALPKRINEALAKGAPGSPYSKGGLIAGRENELALSSTGPYANAQQCDRVSAR